MPARAHPGTGTLGGNSFWRERPRDRRGVLGEEARRGMRRVRRDRLDPAPRLPLGHRRYLGRAVFARSSVLRLFSPPRCSRAFCSRRFTVSSRVRVGAWPFSFRGVFLSITASRAILANLAEARWLTAMS